MSKDAYNYKRYAIKAAKELCYSQTVIEKLELATTEIEIEHIMNNARKGLK